jgi:hypothetical protein
MVSYQTLQRTNLHHKTTAHQTVPAAGAMAIGSAGVGGTGVGAGVGAGWTQHIWPAGHLLFAVEAEVSFFITPLCLAQVAATQQKPVSASTLHGWFALLLAGNTR